MVKFYNQSMTEQTIPASEFKAKCLRLLEEIAAEGKSVTITKRGRPIARVSPVSPAVRPLRGTWKPSVRIRGDIVHFNTADDWESNQ
jgi:prevent-host-death family protein